MGKIFENKREFVTSEFHKVTFQKYGDFWRLKEIILDGSLALQNTEKLVEDIRKIYQKLRRK